MANTKQENRDLVALNIPDNASGLVTPINHREVLLEIINSMWSLANAEPLQTSESTFLHNALHNFTGGLQQNGADVWSLNKVEVVNVIGDFPAAALGVITLLADTTYVLGNDINLLTDRIVMQQNTSIRGFESINVTLTYTGTGDLFTMVNSTCNVGNMTVSAVNGRVFNWSSTSGEQLRVTDFQCSSAQFGTFSGSLSILRFTNVSPSFSVGGLTFAGTWASVLWEVSGAGVNGGIFFDLGAAEFNSILIDKTLMTLAAGTTFLSGLAGSANILAGGLGTVLLTRIGGTGAVLSGITADDAFWEFFHNDEIPDTRPDLLLSMQGNAVETVIAASSTDGSNAVLVAGVWTIIEGSQMTGTAAGRSTYDGGKDAKLPITYSVSVAPITGNDIPMSVYVAIDGVIDVNSRRQGTTSSGDPTSITMPWQDSFSTGGFHEVYVENNSTTANLIVSSAISRTN